MLYTEDDIELKHSQNLEQANQVLKGLDVANGRSPSFKGLNGWIFEQTIHSCLADELREHWCKLTIKEQVKLKGRASADLRVGNVVIEIKSGGLFADESVKYSRYREYAKELGYKYLYLTLQETYPPYANAAKKAFGDSNTFFLKDDKGSWERFVKKIAEINQLQF